MKAMWDAFLKVNIKGGQWKHNLFHIFVWGFAPVVWALIVLGIFLDGPVSVVVAVITMSIAWAPVVSKRAFMFYNDYGFSCPWHQRRWQEEEEPKDSPPTSVG